MPLQFAMQFPTADGGEKNFVGFGLPEKEQLATAVQRACGTGSM